MVVLTQTRLDVQVVLRTDFLFLSRKNRGWELRRVVPLICGDCVNHLLSVRVRQHDLAIEVPGRVPEHWQHNSQTNEKRQTT